jgi:hypothetical protein
MRLPMASATEKTTPIMVSVATGLFFERPYQHRAEEQHRGGADQWVDVERERYPDARQCDV